jgi:hypothetical protein
MRCKPVAAVVVAELKRSHDFCNNSSRKVWLELMFANPEGVDLANPKHLSAVISFVESWGCRLTGADSKHEAPAGQAPHKSWNAYGRESAKHLEANHVEKLKGLVSPKEWIELAKLLEESLYETFDDFVARVSARGL